jgi:uncharacterized repeat protein (TIGR03803 family)
MNKDGSGYTIIRSFSGNSFDGGSPTGPLAQGNDGALYGTSSLGGSSGLGTVFKLSTDGTGFAILHHFTHTAGDGLVPYGGLTRGNDGAFYGVAYGGGDLGLGAVFRLWSSQAPTMMSIKLSSITSVTFGGVPGLKYNLFRSSDLASWSNIYTIVMPPSGFYTKRDGSPLPQGAFYRAAYTQ